MKKSSNGVVVGILLTINMLFVTILSGCGGKPAVRDIAGEPIEIVSEQAANSQGVVCVPIALFEGWLKENIKRCHIDVIATTPVSYPRGYYIVYTPIVH